MRFPLNEQRVTGYDYGKPTSYSAKHLGVDWKADYVPLYAPKNGTIANRLIGTEGGMTLWFKPDGEDVIIRWLHLSKFLAQANQHVTEGQQLAITGNTGHSDRPHLHEDIWKSKVTLNFNNTLNPHEYYKKGNMNPNVVIYKKGDEYQLAHKAISPEGLAQQLIEAGCNDLLTPEGKPNFPKIDLLAHNV